MVVAHYSTAYLAIPLLAIAAVLQWGTSWFRPVPRLTGAALLACVVSVGGAAFWYGSLTHSTSNMSQFVEAAEGQGLNLLPNSGANVVATYLQGESDQAVTPVQYQSLIASNYRTNDQLHNAAPRCEPGAVRAQARRRPRPSRDIAALAPRR